MAGMGRDRGTSMVRRTACFLLASLLMAGQAAAWPWHTVKVGEAPPDDLSRDASGHRVRLSDYRGKVVILSFFASWCPPCRKEVPILAGIQRQAMNDIKVFSIDYQEDRARFRAVVKVLKDTPLTLISDPYGSLGYRYGVNSLPHMIIIGRDGRVVAVHKGYSEQELKPLVNEINTLLAARPAAHT